MLDVSHAIAHLAMSRDTVIRAFSGYRLNLAVVLMLAGCSVTPTHSGSELFATHCASCHGRYGEGDGPVAVDIASHIPDLRYLATRNGGVFPHARVKNIVDGTGAVAAHGLRAMPVWGDAFADLDGSGKSARAKIDALVDYLSTIQQDR